MIGQLHHGGDRGTCCDRRLHLRPGQRKEEARCVLVISTTRTANTSSPRPKTPYPWINYLGSENFFALDLAPGGRLLLLPRRAPAAADALPLQQRPDRRRRALLLHQRRRRRLEPELRAGQDRRWTLRVPPRPRLHAASPASARASRAELLILRADRPHRRGPPGHADEHVGAAPKPSSCSRSSSGACGTPTTT